MIVKLKPENTQLITQIDRAEEIYHSYKLQHKQLTKYPSRLSVKAWDKIELANIVARSATLLQNKGVVLGYFDGPKILGAASLIRQPLACAKPTLVMDILYVSASSRGMGVGRSLFNAIKKQAGNFGAAAVYISATPTTNTVDFYLNNGCTITQPDQLMLQKEPDDIHLIFKLT